EEVLLSVHVDRGQARPGDRDAGAGVGGGQAGPAQEVLERGRSVPAEVAFGQFTERLLPLGQAGVRDPLVDTDDQLLAVLHRAETHRPGLGEVPQQVVAALSGRVDATVLPDRHELVAPQPATARERVRSEERRVGKECRSRWARYN